MPQAPGLPPGVTNAIALERLNSPDLRPSTPAAEGAAAGSTPTRRHSADLPLSARGSQGGAGTAPRRSLEGLRARSLGQGAPAARSQGPAPLQQSAGDGGEHGAVGQAAVGASSGGKASTSTSASSAASSEGKAKSPETSALNPLPSPIAMNETAATRAAQTVQGTSAPEGGTRVASSTAATSTAKTAAASAAPEGGALTPPVAPSSNTSTPPSPLPADHQALALVRRISAQRDDALASVRPVGTDHRPSAPTGTNATSNSSAVTRPTSNSTAVTRPTAGGQSAIARPADLEAQGTAHAPRQASPGMFFLMQNVRHAGPVAGVRTVVQGVIAPELARAVVSNPNVALGVQAGLAAMSLVRRVLSQMHSESAPAVANRAFAGHSDAVQNSVPRRMWQGVQSLGIAGGDAAALTLTVLARTRPELAPVAQSAAAIQVLSHLQSQLREMLRPAINTVHVGNSDPSVPQPPEGRNLRGADIPWSMRASFGGMAGAIDLVAQLAGQFALGGQPAWQSPRAMAAVAGVIGGVANMVTSSVEDHLVDNASARRMQQTDPSHVTHLHNDFRNPFTRTELGRQAERADTRVFNTMVPAMVALGVMQALQGALNQPGVPQAGRIAAQATVHALCAGLMLGSLLALTVKSYQLNDDVRRHQAGQRAQVGGNT